MTGQQIGNWILGDEIGRGPLGVVYKARAVDDPSRFAAVKLLTHESARVPTFLSKFPAEMLGLHRLNHPNIAKYYDAGVHHGTAWYSSEYVVGSDCANLLKTHPRPDGPGLSWSESLLAIAVQAARALKHGHHRSLLHRDLKPSNVLVQSDGSVKLTDFGVAKVFNLPPLSLPADPMGTAGFTAPEHFNGKPLTRRSDLYALGCVLYALATGRPPFAAASAAEFLHKHCYMLPDRPVHFVPDLPADLDELICVLLSKDPARRPASAAAVIEDLDLIRGKIERKGKKVAWPPDPGDASGPMPALSEEDEKLSRKSSEPEPGDRPLMSRPAVVIPLFLAVLGIALAAVFWPRTSAEELYNQATPLIESKDPADWERAWDEYLEPLSTRYPDQYVEVVADIREKVKARRALRQALVEPPSRKTRSEPERLYERGLALISAGDRAGAERTWRNLTIAFADVQTDEEKRWVAIATAALDELAKRQATPQTNREGFRTALDRARALKAGGRTAEAENVLNALEELYRDSPAALEEIRAAR